jgi:predicted nucleic acid-binding protein
VLLVLDSGPLGLLSNPSSRGLAREAHEWARTHILAGDRLVVPEIADYEVRRELIRANKELGLARLDELCNGFGYLPITTATMHTAASLWAKARNEGQATAHDAALDGDVILAAQAQNLDPGDHGKTLIVATTNVSHLKRYVDARLWSEI